MNKDRIAGGARKLGGDAEAFLGRATNDDDLEAQGSLDHALGSVQEGYGRVRDTILDLIDDAPGAAREAVQTGRDYYRRGAAAVTRTAGDNTALTLLAAGVAVAAVSWLVFGRRRSTGK